MGAHPRGGHPLKVGLCNPGSYSQKNPRVGSLMLGIAQSPPGASYESLQALLSTRRACLSLSLDRLERERIQNRALREQLAALRKAVHGGNTEAAGQPAAAPEQGGEPGAPPCRQQDYDSVQGGGAVSVGRCMRVVPIMLVGEDGQRAPASVVVEAGYVEVVTSRGRAEATGFAVLTACSTSDAAAGASAGTLGARKASSSSFKNKAAQNSGGGLFCCFAPPTEPGGSDEFSDAAVAGPSSRPADAAAVGGEAAWRLEWRPQGGDAQRLVFQAGPRTYASLQRHTQRWLGIDHAASSGTSDDPGSIVPPQPLCMCGSVTMQLAGEPSQLLSDAHWRALASAVPPLERLRPWKLCYSTARHGTSLATLYRRSAAVVPTLLIVRDSSGYVFGCYTADGWRVSPRYYGTGETFVFQLDPHRLMYPWRSTLSAKNDFFQYAIPNSLAVGGLGKYAICLDGELLQGSSGTCGTFGSPSLSGRDDFKVHAVEVWQAT